MAPVLPDCSRDFLIDVAAYMKTVGMVLVQEDEELHKHVIYYLSQNLIEVEIHYSMWRSLPWPSFMRFRY